MLNRHAVSTRGTTSASRNTPSGHDDLACGVVVEAKQRHVLERVSRTARRTRCSSSTPARPAPRRTPARGSTSVAARYPRRTPAGVGVARAAADLRVAVPAHRWQRRSALAATPTASRALPSVKLGTVRCMPPIIRASLVVDGQQDHRRPCRHVAEGLPCGRHGRLSLHRADDNGGMEGVGAAAGVLHGPARDRRRHLPVPARPRREHPPVRTSTPTRGRRVLHAYRVPARRGQADADELERAFIREVAEPFGMDWRMNYAAHRKRVAILVSRYDHCLAELLWRWRPGRAARRHPADGLQPPDLRARPSASASASSTSRCSAAPSRRPRRAARAARRRRST